MKLKSLAIAFTAATALAVESGCAKRAPDIMPREYVGHGARDIMPRELVGSGPTAAQTRDNAFNPDMCKTDRAAHERACTLFEQAVAQGPEKGSEFLADPIPLKDEKMFVGMALGVYDGRHGSAPNFKPSGFYDNHPAGKCETIVIKEQPINKEIATGMPYMTRVFFDISTRVEDEATVRGHTPYYQQSSNVIDAALKNVETVVPQGREAYIGCFNNGTNAYFSVASVASAADHITGQWLRTYRDLQYWLKESAATQKPKFER